MGDRLVLRDDGVARRHLVARQGPRLVGTDDRGGAQGLDGWQAAHHGIACRHPLHADRQGDGDDCRQALGYEAYRQRHHRHERLDPVVASQKTAKRKRRRAPMMANQVNWVPKRLIWRSSGVVSSSTSASSALMRPISVALPVATTTPRPWPVAIMVPE